MDNLFSYHQMNENSLLITIAAAENVIELRFAIASTLQDHFKEDITINHGLESLLVIWVNREISIQLIDQIKSLLVVPPLVKMDAGSSWKFPVYYDSKSNDMKQLAQRLSLTVSQIIALHTAANYKVSFIGFLPGFPYLEGLPSELYVPRKATPSLQVAQGAVAISAGMCGIYPQESPGGWYVLGRCPLFLFDKQRKDPFLLKANDSVDFYPVEKSVYEELFSSKNLNLNQFRNG